MSTDEIDHSKPLPENKRGVISHGDMIVEASLSGEISAVFSVMIDNEGGLSVRWSGFADTYQLLGAMDAGNLMAKQKIYSMREK